MLKKVFITVGTILLFSQVFAQVNTFGEQTKTEKEWHFALRLMPGLSGSLIQTAIIKETGDKPEIIFIPVNDWINQVIGLEVSAANPDKENLIKKYNVFEVPGDIKDKGTDAKEYTIKKTEAILNNLWRVKYSEYPFFNPDMNHEKGWAKNPDDKITWMPSESQIALLRPYGIKNLSDFFIGEHLFDFLKDVRNRDWQNRYIQSAGVRSQAP
ncbi:MAG: hypothetical protein GXO50_06385 [Chlorobi bacterium]|nr:hypothetical protein [Chlorobiota bacterium]